MRKQLTLNYDTLAQAAKPLHDKIRARKRKRHSQAAKKGIRTHKMVDPAVREAVKVFHA